MRTQTFKFGKATFQLMGSVVKQIAGNRNCTLTQISRELRTIVNSYSGLNRRERASLYNNAFNCARRIKASGQDWERTIASRPVYDSFMAMSRRVDASFASRQKRIALGKAISDYENQHGTEPVFYLCSYHSNCSCGHEHLQGKIYVTRYWRTIVGSTDYRKVAAYIKNRNVQTIQSVVKAPTWLTTRPYCRHYFVPVQTSDVLTASPKRLLHDNDAFHYTPDYYDSDAYFQIRKQIYTQLNALHPCDAFARLMR